MIEIRPLVDVELAIVIGGGNIGRGSALKADLGIGRETADYMGMAATMVNALLLRDRLQKVVFQRRVIVANKIRADELGEPFIPEKIRKRLSEGDIVIISGGTGNPGVTTDTGAVTHAYGLGADLVVKATKVSGVYDKDPNKHADAKLIPRLSYDEYLSRDLKILDSTAIALAREHEIPIRVIAISEVGALARVCAGEDVGSLIHN
jgi:uridylate kinase